MKIFVTGVSSGIGRELARQLVQDGHEVWGVARRQELLENLAKELAGKKFTHVVCDITKPEGVQAVIKQMAESNFLPEVAVLNAGIYLPDIERSYNHHQAKEVYRTNLDGALVWVEKFLPGLLQKQYGQFIAISSLSAFHPDPESSSYSASKAALAMAFRSFRLRYDNSGIKFKTVHFGPVDTLVIPRFVHSKKGRWVISAERAAKFIRKVMRLEAGEYYYPATSWLLRLASFLPDRFFHKLTSSFRR